VSAEEGGDGPIVELRPMPQGRRGQQTLLKPDD